MVVFLLVLAVVIGLIALMASSTGARTDASKLGQGSRFLSSCFGRLIPLPPLPLSRGLVGLTVGNLSHLHWAILWRLV
ncbi:MAG: hypothetical protein DMG05_21665 [Acidobacteria bacterium]|nr:MAG: hypothetical protein DMG05_21665 [Acidobacteriota bacterium]